MAVSPAQVREATKMLDRGESPNHVARILHVGRSTLYRLA
ncbi:MAG: helix-turn-helix domain-containing protein [Vulcanimicrobiaceae bacterium]